MTIDSFQNESALGKKFISYNDWYEGGLPPLTDSEIFSQHRIYSPWVIQEQLLIAKNAYENIPGPRLEFRRQHSEEWLGFWINFMEMIGERGTGYPYIYSHNITNYDGLQKVLSKTSIWRGMNYPAVWFAGGLELTKNHRDAIDFVTRRENFFPIIWLESESYIKSKERGNPFLQQALKLSMLSYYISVACGNKAVITTNPLGVGVDGVRQFDYNTGVEYWATLETILNDSTSNLGYFASFYNESDPRSVAMSKQIRSNHAFLSMELEIPTFDNPSTTELVRI